MTVTVHHVVEGPPQAPVIVLSNSVGTELSMWDPQVPALAQTHRVVRYDLRGHGRSPVTAGPYDIADLGDDLLALLDRLEIERATLCGVSIGAMASIWAAAHAPHVVDRLILCCTTYRFPDEVRSAYLERAELVRESGLQPIADAALARWFTPAVQDGVAGRLRASLLATPREGYASCCEALAAMDLEADLAQIAAPTLVISAAEDPATPPEQGRALAGLIADARFELVENAAHLANLEQAERVTALIEEFVDDR